MRREEKRREEKIVAVDFFKGVATIGIVLVHYYGAFVIPEFLQHILHFGQMGCQIFLVLSSFTLCASYDRRPVKYSKFLVKRLFRISIGYWMGILATIFVSIFSIFLLGYNITGSDLKPLDILANVCLMHGLIPTQANNRVVRGGWFVGTIILFYIAFPFLYKLYFSKKFSYKKSAIAVLATTLIPIVVFRLFGIECTNNSFAYFSILNQLPCLMVGVVLFELYREDRFSIIKASLAKSVICLVISYVLFNFAKHNTVNSLFPVAFSISFAYLFIFAINNIRFKYNGWTSKLGRISFGVYLMHPFVVYDAMLLILYPIRHILGKQPGIFAFLILLIPAFVITYAVGTRFCKTEKTVQVKAMKSIEKIRSYRRE